MSIVYLNGKYIPKREATVSIEDRGFLFADGIYEVVRCYRGQAFLIEQHLDRMRSSLKAIQLEVSIDHLAEVTHELLQRNNLADARVYWQVTRGPAPRQHVMPKTITPTILAMVDSAEEIEETTVLHQGRAILEPDRRWLDCGIKTLMLLPGVLMRQKADEAGCIEAILHRDGIITEGAATSVFAVIDDQLRTHPVDGTILAGVTRRLVIELAGKLHIPVRERAFTVDDLPNACELFITGTTTHITALSHCANYTYPTNPIAQQLHRALIDHILRNSAAM